MRASRLLEDFSPSFGPEALNVISQAFDAAWAEIAGNFGDTPQQIEIARLKLADSILSMASDASQDVELLKNAGLAVMAQRYRA